MEYSVCYLEAEYLEEFFPLLPLEVQLYPQGHLFFGAIDEEFNPAAVLVVDEDEEGFHVVCIKKFPEYSDDAIEILIKRADFLRFEGEKPLPTKFYFRGDEDLDSNDLLRILVDDEAYIFEEINKIYKITPEVRKNDRSAKLVQQAQDAKSLLESPLKIIESNIQKIVDDGDEYLRYLDIDEIDWELSSFVLDGGELKAFLLARGSSSDTIEVMYFWGHDPSALNMVMGRFLACVEANYPNSNIELLITDSRISKLINYIFTDFEEIQFYQASRPVFDDLFVNTMFK